MEMAAEGMKDAMEESSEKANIRGHRQFRLLTTGAVLYFFWHIVEMYFLAEAPTH